MRQVGDIDRFRKPIKQRVDAVIGTMKASLQKSRLLP